MRGCPMNIHVCDGPTANVYVDQLAEPCISFLCSDKPIFPYNSNTLAILSKPNFSGSHTPVITPVMLVGCCSV